MAVDGISDELRLPRLGKVKIGITTTNAAGTSYPKAVDYFVVGEDIEAVFGEKPKTLRIMLPSQEREENFPIWLKMYGKSRGLVCKGNGKVATRVNTETGEMIEIPCLHEECEDFKCKPARCKIIGVLSFLLPEVPGALGVYQIATSSRNSRLNLNSAMDLCKKLCNGKLAGIPLELSVEPQQTQADGKVKTIYVLQLRAPFALAQLRALPAFEPQPMSALPGSDDLPAELYPELTGQATEENGDHAEVTEAEIVPKEESPAKPAAKEPNPAPDQEANICSACSEGITSAMRTFSQHEFGKTLCSNCQPKTPIRDG